MAKGMRRTVKIDEEKLKEMMAGDVPKFEIEGDNASSKDDQQGNEDKSSTKKLADVEKYKDTFLQRSASRTRKGTYISHENWTVLSDILPAIAPELSIPYFLDNLIKDHIEKYKNEIKELYDIEMENKKKRYDFL